jgi:hypothetical protein
MVETYDFGCNKDTNFIRRNNVVASNVKVFPPRLNLIQRNISRSSQEYVLEQGVVPKRLANVLFVTK